MKAVTPVIAGKTMHANPAASAWIKPHGQRAITVGMTGTGSKNVVVVNLSTEGVGDLAKVHSEPPAPSLATGALDLP